MTTNAPDAAEGTTKIERVTRTYGLDDMGEELERRWLGTDGVKQSSTRELADYFNKAVLRAAVKESETFTLSSGVDEVYRTLADGENADATIVRSRLEQSGIDAETVTGDFISHQTVYRYLKDHRGVEQPQRSAADELENAVDVVQQLQGRTTVVTEQKIQSLKDKELVSVDGFSVLNDIQVICERCGRSHEVTSFFERGGCSCED